VLVQEKRILSHLSKLKILIPNLRIGILGCKTRNLDKEKKYFDNHLKEIKYEFIPQSKSRKTYNIIDKAELMLAIDSSLIYETLARGNKVCVFGNRSRKYPLNSSRFAWPANLNNEGFFWSSKNNFKTFHKIVLRCLNTSNIRYFKKYKKDFYNSLSIYDYKNKKFKKITRKLIEKK
jgi:surface carbohydrate biosynthesis protein